MISAHIRLIGRGSALLLVATSAFALASCASPKPKASVEAKQPTRSKEYFAESEYGVKASPRVSSLRSGLPRGGGREQVGKPYKVKGKWYHPQEKQTGERSAGIASWYGDAFHGRLTANGEVYDMTHLTAAHPTMPLPSYARVTNARNGSSVIVRVNDRGPFAHGRVIDLSRRAAELLDYTGQGVTRVDVEYIGRAPLHGNDDEYLVASYRPGGRAPDPSDGMPSGVMIAMNGPTPQTEVTATASAFPGELRSTTLEAPVAAGAGSVPAFAEDHHPVLPESGPLLPPRPGIVLAGRLGADSVGSVLSSYADQRVKRAAQAVDDFAESRMAERADLSDALRQRFAAAPTAQPASEYVAVGTYANQEGAEAIASALASMGRVRVETDFRRDSYTVSLYPDGSATLDNMLKSAWAAGAVEAMPVRD